MSGLMAKLSQQSLSFGHVPLFSAVRRLVFVSNLSEHTLSYHWNLGSELAKEVSQAGQALYVYTPNSYTIKIDFFCVCMHIEVISKELSTA